MIFKRRGSTRNEGTLTTKGRVDRICYESRDRSFHMHLAAVPNFNNGAGMHDWEIVMTTRELVQLVNAVAAADRSKLSLGASLERCKQALATLLDWTGSGSAVCE